MTTPSPNQNLGSTSASGNADPRQNRDQHPEGNPEPAPQESPEQAAEAAPSSDRYGRNETARNPNLDPDPAQNPGLRNEEDLEPGQTPQESKFRHGHSPGTGPEHPAEEQTSAHRRQHCHRIAAGAGIRRLYRRPHRLRPLKPALLSGPVIALQPLRGCGLAWPAELRVRPASPAGSDAYRIHAYPGQYRSPPWPDRL